MAPRRCENQCRVVLEMHKQGSLYSQISVVLGIPRSTCSDIVHRFGERGHLRDRIYTSRPQIFDKCGDREVVRRVNDPSTSIAVAIGRSLQFEGTMLRLDDIVRRSLRRQGLHARVKIQKPLLTKKHKKRYYS